MISTIPGDFEKFALLGKLFRVISLEYMTQLIGEELVAGKLKGTSDSSPGPVSQLVNECMRLDSKLISLRRDLFVLNADFVSLLKITSKTLYNYGVPSELATLKNKNGVY